MVASSRRSDTLGAVPRIHANSIAEHVAQQEIAILGAAEELFATKGIAATDLGDIANAVGLARSSLYRYFPSKDHILLRWFELEMKPVFDEAISIATADGDPTDRLLRWLDFQLDYLGDPSHRLAPRLQQEIGSVSSEVQAAIAAGHVEVYATASDLVAEILAQHPPGRGRRRRDAALVSRLLTGLLQSSAQAELAGTSAIEVRRELHHAALALVAPSPGSSEEGMSHVADT